MRVSIHDIRRKDSTIVLYVHWIQKLNEYTNSLYMPNFIPTAFDLESCKSGDTEKV